MILKKQVAKPGKKIKPITGILLFSISVILLIITVPIGIIYGLLFSIFTKGFRGLDAYLLNIAIAIDQLGNVIMQHLLNALWIKKEGYKFGNRDETISSALGRNKKLGLLAPFGKSIDKILDYIDPNHSLNSINYYIEPSEQIIDKLAWVHLVDGQILSTRSKGKTKFYIPVGKREKGESDEQAIFREIKEELSVKLDLSSLNFFGVFEAQADGHKPGILVRMNCYSATYTGELLPDSEIEEMVWLNYSDFNKISKVDQLIFDFLKDKGLLK